METLEFRYRGGTPTQAQRGAVLRGVLSSGGLEVLVEPSSLDGEFKVTIRTAAHGFGTIWQAVLDDVFMRWPLADVLISINDAGATPAVVSLRLDQALQDYSGAVK